MPDTGVLAFERELVKERHRVLVVDDHVRRQIRGPGRFDDDVGLREGVNPVHLGRCLVAQPPRAVAVPGVVAARLRNVHGELLTVGAVDQTLALHGAAAVVGVGNDLEVVVEPAVVCLGLRDMQRIIGDAGKTIEAVVAIRTRPARHDDDIDVGLRGNLTGDDLDHVVGTIGKGLVKPTPIVAIAIDVHGDAGWNLQGEVTDTIGITGKAGRCSDQQRGS